MRRYKKIGTNIPIAPKINSKITSFPVGRTKISNPVKCKTIRRGQYKRIFETPTKSISNKKYHIEVNLPIKERKIGMISGGARSKYFA
jgi:hypothetical protein